MNFFGKVTPQVIAVWSRILNSLPHSRLLILIPGGAEPNASDPAGTINTHYQVTSIDWGDGTPLDTSTATLSLSSGVSCAILAEPYRH